MTATVAVHPCAHFQDAVRAIVDRTPHPGSYDLRLNGCKAVIRCSSKLAWISVRQGLRRWRETLTVRGYATHGRYAVVVGVRS